MPRHVGDRGFSIGVDDVTPSIGMTKIKNKLVIEGQRLAQEEIQAYTTGTYARNYIVIDIHIGIDIDIWGFFEFFHSLFSLLFINILLIFLILLFLYDTNNLTFPLCTSSIYAYIFNFFSILFFPAQ